MIDLELKLEDSKPLTVLCLGAHSDDIEIGCGGTILRWCDQYPGMVVHWVVFSAPGAREAEAKQSAELFVNAAELRGPVLRAFSDGFMPFEGSEVKKTFEGLKSVSPDLIFTHNSRDAHQDHRLLAELTWNTFRNHLILEYEIPKYDGDMGRPSVFVPLESQIVEKKVRYLMDAFPSQRSKHWFQENTFLALLRLRGMECNAPSGYAEAFYCRKLVL